MGLQVSFLIESALAVLFGTHELFLPQMGLQVDIQPLLPAVGLPAVLVCALEYLLLEMGLHVVV